MSAKSAAEMSKSSSKSAAPAAAAAASAAAAGPEAAAAAAAEGWTGAAGVAQGAGSSPPEPSSAGEGAVKLPPAGCVSCCAAELLPKCISSSLPGDASAAADVLGAAAAPGAGHVGVSSGSRNGAGTRGQRRGCMRDPAFQDCTDVPGCIS